MENKNSILKNKDTIKELLEKILKTNIQDIEFIGTKKFEGIIEYKFSLLKINLIYNENSKDEIYLKIIQGGKIKESIFCFWSILYEEYLRNNKKNKSNNELQKTIITQKTAEEYNNKIMLNFNHNLQFCAEINLINLKEFARKDNKYGRWVEDLKIKSEDILFIGKKIY